MVNWITCLIGQRVWCLYKSDCLYSSWSHWPHGLRCGSTAARFPRNWVRIQPGAWMYVVSFVCCQVEISVTSWSLVQRSPTELGVSEYDRRVSIIGRLRSTVDTVLMKKEIHTVFTTLWQCFLAWESPDSFILSQPMSLRFIYISCSNKCFHITNRSCFLREI